MPHPQGTCVLLEVNTLNELINSFQGLFQNPNVLFELKGVHINEKTMWYNIFLINSCQLTPSKQIMQMLKLQPFIFTCYDVVPHLFITFVFPLSNIVGIRIHRHWIESLTMQTSFTKKNSVAITIHWLSTIS